MAQHKSAKKRIRQTERRTLVNRMQMSRMRTFLKKVETALASGDKTAAQEAFREAEPVIASAGGKGIIHRNTAARKISRLSKRVNALGA